MVPLFGAAYAASNTGITTLYRFRSPKTVLNLPVNIKSQGLVKAFECILSTFQGKFNFSRTFQDSPVYSSTFQACANPVIFANSLGPDEARKNVGPHLDPNCWTLYW